MNIIFAGTPAFAIPSLHALAHSQHHLSAIYTQPDRPAGRGQRLQASAVKTWGMEHNIPIFQPSDFKTAQNIETFQALSPDLFIVIAYGLILPRSILDTPRYGCINVHASLLPRWRGASPIQHAILHGDNESGITIMQMDAGMDTGAMLAKVPCPVQNHDTAASLHDRLSALAPTVLLEVLNKFTQNNQHPEVQNNADATYAPKIKKEDACIQWHQPASHIDRQIREFNPWPIAYTHFDGQLLKIHQAIIDKTTTTQKPGTIIALDKNGIQIATGRDCIQIQCLQFSGGKVMSVADYLNANTCQLHQNQVLG